LVFESGSKKMNFNAAKRVDPLAGVDGNAMTFTGDSDDLSSVRNSLVSTLTVTPTDKVATITYPSTYPNASVTFNYNNLDNLTSIVDSRLPISTTLPETSPRSPIRGLTRR
jgi:hypothetical protein